MHHLSDDDFWAETPEELAWNEREPCPACRNTRQGCNASGCGGRQQRGWRGWPIVVETPREPSQPSAEEWPINYGAKPEPGCAQTREQMGTQRCHSQACQRCWPREFDPARPEIPREELPQRHTPRNPVTSELIPQRAPNMEFRVVFRAWERHPAGEPGIVKAREDIVAGPITSADLALIAAFADMPRNGPWYVLLETMEGLSVEFRPAAPPTPEDAPTEPIDAPRPERHTARMLRFLAEARKALAAALLAGGGAILAALGESSPGGSAILSSEAWGALALALATAGGVWAVPNAMSARQMAQASAKARRILAQDRAPRHAYAEPTETPTDPWV